MVKLDKPPGLSGLGRNRLKFAKLCLALWTVYGCSNVSAWLRRHTYPPDFAYITQEELKSTMWQLARNIRQLDETIRRPAPIDESRAEILRLLGSMEHAAASLSHGGKVSNHPEIDLNLTSFRRDVELARNGVESTPANYTLVRLLPGACLHCHRSGD